MSRLPILLITLGLAAVAGVVSTFTSWPLRVPGTAPVKETSPGEIAAAHLRVEAEDGLSKLLPIPLTAVTGHMVQFRLAGTTFRIPDTHLDTILQESRHARGELSGGFTMVGMGPHFAPKTHETLSKFNYDGNAIRVSVERACPPHPNDQSPPIPCTPERAMKIAYRVFGLQTSLPGVFMARAEHLSVPAKAVPGLDLAGFRNNLPIDKFDSGDFYDANNRTVYHGTDSEGRIRFATCTRATDPWMRYCDIKFIWRDRFKISLHMRAINMARWQQIRDTVLAILESYIVTEDTQPAPPGIKVINYPINPE